MDISTPKLQDGNNSPGGDNFNTNINMDIVNYSYDLIFLNQIMRCRKL